MTKCSPSMPAGAIVSVALPLMFAVGSAVAAPAILSTSGTFNHNGTVTISGSGFGSKATAAPVVWDNASGASILNKWDGAWPSNNASYNLAYRTPIRGIGLPHNNISKYIAGAHAESLGYNAGYNVIFWKTRTIASYPAYTYASWYQRSDDNWVFGLGSPPDDNYKVFDYSSGTSPYNLPNNWYLEYNARPTSRNAIPSWHINDDGTSLVSPDTAGHSWWWNAAVNPMAGQWTKIEVEIKYSTQSDGYIKLWENGALKINYAARTDSMSTTTRAEGIGGYSRDYGNANNWRYFADAYLDYTPARVVLANNSNLSSASIVETQIPTSWNATTINITVNLGKFLTGQAAYLFVFDSTGAHNAAGFPVTAGASGGGTPPLSPPTNLRVM